MPTNVGPRTRTELRHAPKGLLSRLLAYCFKVSGYSLLFGRNSFRMPPNRMGPEADARLRRVFELDEDEPENPIGLPEAELTIEDSRKRKRNFSGGIRRRKSLENYFRTAS